MGRVSNTELQSYSQDNFRSEDLKTFKQRLAILPDMAEGPVEDDWERVCAVGGQVSPDDVEDRQLQTGFHGSGRNWHCRVCPLWQGELPNPIPVDFLPLGHQLQRSPRHQAEQVWSD